ncbi:MAG: hypothetical protein RMM53_09520 [Bacteroidia bacterium]|nr:hypothetical protein [Bacteroidia bacterium]MDW8334439.1 hypothetical protein [Bacteroidia bacterium]
MWKKIRWVRPAGAAAALSLSALLWYSLKLTRVYSTKIELPVKFVNIPPGVKLEKTLPTTLELSVTGKGTELLLPSLRLGVDTLEIDVKPYLPHGYLHTPKLTDMLMRVLPGSISIHGFKPDTVSLAFSQKIRRRLKILPRVNFVAPSGFMMTTQPIYEPDEVTIFGAQEDVSKPEAWPTEQTTIVIPQGETRFTVPMLKSEDVIVEPPAVTALVVYERFSEGTVELPIELTGSLAAGCRVRFSPERVKVKYLAPFSRFDAVDEDDFAVEVEVEQLDANARYVHPRLARIPRGVRYAHIEPAHVRFVVRCETL